MDLDLFYLIWIIMQKNIIHHTIWASSDVKSQSVLSQLNTKQALVDKFQAEGLIIHEWRDWLVTLKSWPYSDKDLMIIYIWDQAEEKISIENNSEIQELLEATIKGLLEKYSDEISNGEYELRLGRNNVKKPWAWKAQSLTPWHYHITLYPTKVGELNNIITTQIEGIEEKLWVQKFMWINAQNLELIQSFRDNLPMDFLNRMKESIIVNQKEYYALDFELETGEEFFWQVSIDIINGLLNELTGFIWWDKTQKLCQPNLDSLWFIFGFYKENGENYIRIRFSYLNEWEDVWIPEIFWHIIKRDFTKPLPNVSNFKKKLLDIF